MSGWHRSPCRALPPPPSQGPRAKALRTPSLQSARDPAELPRDAGGARAGASEPRKVPGPPMQPPAWSLRGMNHRLRGLPSVLETDANSFTARGPFPPVPAVRTRPRVKVQTVRGDTPTWTHGRAPAAWPCGLSAPRGLPSSAQLWAALRQARRARGRGCSLPLHARVKAELFTCRRLSFWPAIDQFFNKQRSEAAQLGRSLHSGCRLHGL